MASWPFNNPACKNFVDNIVKDLVNGLLNFFGILYIYGRCARIYVERMQKLTEAFRPKEFLQMSET